MTNKAKTLSARDRRSLAYGANFTERRENKASATRVSARKFYPRFLRLAAINELGRTKTQQIWVNDQQDIYDAERELMKWALPAEERWSGRILIATLYDDRTKVMRVFNRDGELLKESTAAHAELFGRCS